jgi:hypothetical protein
MGEHGGERTEERRPETSPIGLQDNGSGNADVIGM